VREKGREGEESRDGERNVKERKLERGVEMKAARGEDNVQRKRGAGQ
jgi:hypothetical protein